MNRLLLLSLFASLVMTGLAGTQPAPVAQTREQKVRDDRKKVEADGFWIYNDLAQGFAEAKKTGKPLLVVLRCIPCVECVKLDDDLVNQDQRVRPLLEKFVCVRVISTNGLDLALFQFDYDQSFAGFLLNADGTIYGRFGTRSHRTYWSDDVSVEGLAQALKGALELHARYPQNKAELARKRGPAPEVPTPEQFPLLKGRYTAKLATDGKVVASCIHCHQIGDAQRALVREREHRIPEQVLFSYPHPKALGLILDPRERATVLRVDRDSPAEAAGFQKGDQIVKLDGQPLLSIADVQWVLHHASPDGATLQALVKRGEKQVDVALRLPKGWRQRDDISWRASTWALRRTLSGGMLLESLPAEDRAKAGLPEKGMTLRVRYLGSGSGPHGAAQRAGFRQGDILVSLDDRTDLGRETDWLAHANHQHKPGDRVPATVLRGGKEIKLMLPVQE